MKAGQRATTDRNASPTSSAASARSSAAVAPPGSAGSRIGGGPDIVGRPESPSGMVGSQIAPSTRSRVLSRVYRLSPGWHRRRTMRDSHSAVLWDEAGPIWAAIREHPFLRELRAGTLPLETFRYYVTQDYHYLEAFARAVATALTKAPDGETLELLAKRVLTPIERPLHRRLFELAGLQRAEVLAAEIAPTNLAYQNHMLAVAARGGLGEIAAALLPCPWSYHRLGEALEG